MKSKEVLSRLVQALLAIVIGAVLLMPDRVVQNRADGVPGGDGTMRVLGVARDFSGSHPDFEVAAAAAGPYAGLVELHLGPDGLPVLGGPGHRVIRPAWDADHRTIAAHFPNGPLKTAADGVRVLLVVEDDQDPGPGGMARRDVLEAAGHVVSLIDDEAPVEEFNAAYDINDVVYISENACPVPLQDVVPDVPIGLIVEDPMLSAVGLAYESMAVPDATVLEIDDTDHPITSGLPTGPLVVASSPIVMHHAYGGVAAGGRALARLPGAAKPALLVVETGGELLDQRTAPARRVRLPWGVPQGAEGQACNPRLGIDLGVLNEQGLLILDRSIRWAASGNPRGLLGSGQRPGDTPAVLDSAPTAGGILSADTFGHWFEDVPGINRSKVTPLVFRTDDTGTWIFDDTLDSVYQTRRGFFPVDGRSFSNDAMTANNHHFTYQFDAKFAHRQAARRFFRVIGNADVCVFVNDVLVIEMAGGSDLMDQLIDVSRLNLEEDQPYRLSFFLAQRTAGASRLRIETNLYLFPTRPRIAEPSPTAPVVEG